VRSLAYLKTNHRTLEPATRTPTHGGIKSAKDVVGLPVECAHEES
jgi:hypothetical protein